jgi:hypothetical protein
LVRPYTTSPRFEPHHFRMINFDLLLCLCGSKSSLLSSLSWRLGG